MNPTKKKKNFLRFGEQEKPIRDWLYIDDVVRAIYLVTKLKKNYLIPLNITEGKGYTIKKTAESIKTALKFDGSIIFDKNFIDGSPKKNIKAKNFS